MFSFSQLQSVAKSLNKDCLSKTEPHKVAYQLKHVYFIQLFCSLKRKVCFLIIHLLQSSDIPVLFSWRIFEVHKDSSFPCQPCLWFLAGKLFFCIISHSSFYSFYNKQKHSVRRNFHLFQIRNILIPDESDPQKSWIRCKLNIFNCSPRQLQILEGDDLNTHPC